jgi:glycosyltransferase involved in cell wall biosynthesis
MKIFILVGLASSLTNFRGAMISSLIKKGHEVHVVAPGLSDKCTILYDDNILPVDKHSITLSRNGTNLLVDLRSLYEIWQLIRKNRPDVVVCFTIKPILYGILAAWLAFVPRRFAVLTGLGYAFTGDAIGLRRIVRKLAAVGYKIVLPLATKVFFQNQDDEKLFFSLGLIPMDKPSFVMNGSGVDINTFNIQPLPVGPPIFLLIARFLGDKGIREYADSARIIKSLYPGVRFLLAGWIDGSNDSIEHSELDQWHIDGILECVGRLEDVRLTISQSSVFVLPSYREGTPRTVLEAMSMGRPIITTDVPGCRETVENGRNGFLVPAKSVEALVCAMERFIQDPSLSTRMGFISRKIAEEKYNVHRVNAVMLSEMDL